MWRAAEEMKEELRDVYLDIEGWIEDDQYKPLQVREAKD